PAVALARAARVATRRAGRGGTTAAGRVLLRLEPDAIAELSHRLDRGAVLVSATNGKTTTSAMIAAILGQAGIPLVHNRAGSNMHWGVATALLDAGHEPDELGLFEVDEAWLPAVADSVEPRLVLLSNLFRDQLDRYVELQLPGLYNVYNALAAATTALELGATVDQVRAGLETFGGAFGRVERIPVNGRDVLILLVKNPAGANEVLRTLTLEQGQLDLWLALNDRIADGRDVSWIWDADFELLVGRVATVTCSGTRAEEMA